MGRFTELVDIDGHGVYMPIFDVMALLPINDRLASEREKELYADGARAWIVSSSGFMHASTATVAEIHERLTRLEEEQREAERAKREDFKK